jgi:Histone acetylation protein
MTEVSDIVSICSFFYRYVDTGEMLDNFPYRARAMFAFQEQEGADVCFFGMHVQVFLTWQVRSLMYIAPFLDSYFYKDIAISFCCSVRFDPLCDKSARIFFFYESSVTRFYIKTQSEVDFQSFCTVIDFSSCVFFI